MEALDRVLDQVEEVERSLSSLRRCKVTAGAYPIKKTRVPSPKRVATPKGTFDSG